MSFSELKKMSLLGYGSFTRLEKKANPLATTNLLLFTVYCLQFPVPRSLFSVYLLLFTFYFLLFSVSCSPFPLSPLLSHLVTLKDFRRGEESPRTPLR